MTKLTPAGTRSSRVPGWVWDVLCGFAIVAAGFAPGPEGASPPRATLWLSICVLVVVAAAMPLHRRYPMAVFWACVALAVGATFLIVSNEGFLVAAGIAMYFVGTSSTRLKAWLSASAAIVILVVPILFVGSNSRGYDHLLPPITFVAIAAAVGDATRNRRALIAEITERALRAEQDREAEAERRVAEERLHIARELHDAAAHQIAAINLHAGVASNALPDHPQDAERALAVIRSSSRAVLSEISALLRVLRSSAGGAGTTVQPPTVDLGDLDGLIADFTSSGLVVESKIEGSLSTVQGAVSVVAYRIIQEGLANALKHGSERTAQLEVSIHNDRAVVTVVNPIASGAPPEVAPSGQHGLLGVEERVQSVRGSFQAHRGEQTFTLSAELPLGIRPVSGVTRGHE